MGRIIAEQTCVLTNCTQSRYHPQSFSYDQAGNLTGFSDGWGIQSFSQTYDAAGRLTYLTSSWWDTIHPSVLYGVQNFGPVGPLNSRMGSNLGIISSYDSRLRISSKTVGVTQ